MTGDFLMNKKAENSYYNIHDYLLVLRTLCVSHKIDYAEELIDKIEAELKKFLMNFS